MGSVLSFWHVRKKSSFVEAMHLVVGGDTDTNVIVRCMIGALHGADGMPSEFKKVLEYSHDTCGGHPRPDWLLPRHALGQIDSLYNAALAGIKV